MKKTIQRIISIFLCAAVLAGVLCNTALGASVISGKCGKNAEWSYDTKSKTLTISGKGSMYNYSNGSELVPWDSFSSKIKKIVVKKGITRITECAFSGTMQVKGSSISLPNTLTAIDTEAFGDTCPKEITIPGSVKRIRGFTFMFSEAKTIKLKNGVQVIDECAFDRCQAKSITFPSSVTKIGKSAFNYSKVKKVTFKGNAPKIHKKAFADIEDEDSEPRRMTIYYPKGNKTWKSVVKKQYGGKVKWVAKKM